MFGLLMALMSIAMLSAVSVAMVNYMPVDALIAYKARTKTHDGFKQIASGAVRYIKSVSDANGNAFLPAPGTDLSTALQPAFVYIPPAPAGMAWSVVSSSYGGWPAIAICLHPQSTVDPVVARGVLSVQPQFPSASMFVSSTCNAVANSTGNNVTYWVIANHHS